jgi:homoserine dehydrogenase
MVPRTQRPGKQKNRRFLFDNGAGRNTVFSVFRECLPAASLQSFRGIINSTTNIILTRMEQGESFEQAVKHCQELGIAETDPSNDVDGWDAAVKVAALVTVLMDTPCKPAQVERTGIRGLTPAMIAAATREGRRWKLVASAERTEGGVRMRVAPELVEPSSSLYGMNGGAAGLQLRTDVLGDLTISESDREGLPAGPAPTAYAMLPTWSARWQHSLAVALPCGAARRAG